MTDDLSQLLHERADTVHFTSPDLDVVFRDGARRIRRRRVGAVLGGAAVVAAIGGLGVTVLGSSTPDGAPVATDPAAPAAIGPAPVTWAVGSELRSAGGAAVDAGVEIRSYVRTAAGFVLTGPDGTVFSLVDGERSELGRTDAGRGYLAGDADGTRAGWLDVSGDRPRFVVADLADGSVRSYDAQSGDGDPASFDALDGDTAYWRDDRGTVVVDLTTGDAAVLDPAARPGFDVIAAEDGVLATDAGDPGTEVGDVLLPRVYGGLGVFSPQARWFTIDADEPRVFDVLSGEPVRLDLDAWFASGYEWLDDSTVALIAQQRRDTPVQLVTCTVPDGACTVAAPDLGSFETLLEGGFALPVGEAMED